MIPPRVSRLLIGISFSVGLLSGLAELRSLEQMGGGLERRRVPSRSRSLASGPRLPRDGGLVTFSSTMDGSDPTPGAVAPAPSPGKGSEMSAGARPSTLHDLRN